MLVLFPADKYAEVEEQVKRNEGFIIGIRLYARVGAGEGVHRRLRLLYLLMA